MQLGLVSKNACASIRRHGHFALIPRPELKQQQKIRFSGHLQFSKVTLFARWVAQNTVEALAFLVAALTGGFVEELCSAVTFNGSFKAYLVAR
jgi:hypothetical protein